ncbi:MAG: nitrilase, partial [Actinomycetota bacterium]|nr:nitrilase [Actinomycetota bacterium]
PATSAPTGVGRSMLVDPMGAVRIDLGSGPGVATGTVETEMTERVRSVLPSLRHRRPDIFGG